MDKCGGANSKDFWKIVKPLISHKNPGDVLNQHYTCVNLSGSSVLLEGMDDHSDFAAIVTSNITQA